MIMVVKGVSTIRVSSSRQGRSDKPSFKVLSRNDPKLVPTILPETWTNAVSVVDSEWCNDNFSTSSGRYRLLICGAKGVGKSTCLRFTVNTLLQEHKRIAVLDCDAGQPEFSPPGLLSLTICEAPILSPPYARMVVDNGAHAAACFYGHNTSKADPVSYLNSLKRLMDVYKRLVHETCDGRECKLPLIVNTEGWVKSLGFETLSSLVKDIVMPSQIFQLVSSSKAESFDLGPIQNKDMRVHLLDTPGTLAAKTADLAARHRALRIVRYLLPERRLLDGEGLLDTKTSSEFHTVGKELACACPFVVSLDLIDLQVLGEHELASEQGTLDAFNGSLVGVCRQAEEGSHAGVFSCLGVGIVRSIDRTNRLLFLLTPLSQSAMQSGRILVRGSIQAPLDCYFRGVHSCSFPHLTCEGKPSVVGGGVMKSRRNIKR